MSYELIKSKTGKTRRPAGKSWPELKKIKMQPDIKPLFTLTIGEFIALTKKLVEDTLKEKAQNETSLKKDEDDTAVYNISQLTEFLHCSKASIHNYKKLGMPFYRIGRKILFRKNEVLNFMRGLKNKLKRR